MILLEYIKVYETIKDKESDLDYLSIQKTEAQAKINTVRSTESEDEMEQVKATIADIENTEIYTKNSICDARMMLSDMYETKKESFYQCFTEFNSTMLEKDSNSAIKHRLP